MAKNKPLTTFYKRKQVMMRHKDERFNFEFYCKENYIHINFTDKEEPGNGLGATFSASRNSDWIQAVRWANTFANYINEENNKKEK